MENQQSDSFGFSEDELAFMKEELNCAQYNEFAISGVIMGLVGKHLFTRRNYSMGDLVSMEEAVHAVETVSAVAVHDNREIKVATHAFFSFRRLDGWLCCLVTNADLGTLYEFPLRELPFIYMTKEKVTLWDYPLSDPYWLIEANRQALVDQITDLQAELMTRDTEH